MVVERESSVAIHLSTSGLKDGRSGYDEARTGLILYASDITIDLAEEQPVHVQTSICAREPDSEAAATASDLQQRARALADIRDSCETRAKRRGPRASGSKQHGIHVLQQPAAHTLLALANIERCGVPLVVERESSVAIHLSTSGLKDGRSGYDEARTGLILYASDITIDLAEEQPVHVQTSICAREIEAIGGSWRSIVQAEIARALSTCRPCRELCSRWRRSRWWTRRW